MTYTKSYPNQFEEKAKYTKCKLSPLVGESGGVSRRKGQV